MLTFQRRCQQGGQAIVIQTRGPMPRLPTRLRGGYANTPDSISEVSFYHISPRSKLYLPKTNLVGKLLVI